MAPSISSVQSAECNRSAPNATGRPCTTPVAHVQFAPPTCNNVLAGTSKLIEHFPDPDEAVYLNFISRDPQLLTHKSAYFCLCAALAVFSPFVVLILTKNGLNEAQVGGLLAIAPFSQLFAAPLWSYIADRLGKRRLILVGTFLLSAIARLSLYTAGASLWGMAAALLAAEVMGAPGLPMLDAATLGLLQSSPGEGGGYTYGAQRAWGAVGWGLAAAVAGAVVGIAGLDSIFLMFPLLMLPTLVLLWHIPVQSGAAPAFGTSWIESIRTGWNGAKRALTPDILIFCGLGVATGAMYGIVSSFLFLWLAELGATPFLLGITLAVTCISEAPVFLISGRIVAFMGVQPVLLLSIACYAVRLGYYSYLSDPWWTLPGELLHGVTYALNWATSSQYAAELAPPGMGSAAQGLLASLQWGLGLGAGSLIGGVVYQAYGARVLFRYSSSFACALMGILALSMVCRARQAREQAAESKVSDEEGGRPVQAQTMVWYHSAVMNPVRPTARFAQSTERVEVDTVCMQLEPAVLSAVAAADGTIAPTKC